MMETFKFGAAVFGPIIGVALAINGTVDIAAAHGASSGEITAIVIAIMLVFYAALLAVCELTHR